MVLYWSSFLRFFVAVDDGMENLGAGLVSVAGNIGQANNWWAPEKKTSYTGQPS